VSPVRAVVRMRNRRDELIDGQRGHSCHMGGNRHRVLVHRVSVVLDLVLLGACPRGCQFCHFPYVSYDCCSSLSRFIVALCAVVPWHRVQTDFSRHGFPFECDNDDTVRA